MRSARARNAGVAGGVAMVATLTGRVVRGDLTMTAGDHSGATWTRVLLPQRKHKQADEEVSEDLGAQAPSIM